VKREEPLKESAVILAGGYSRRFGRDKSLIQLAGKPLISHVTDRVSKIVEEVVIVVSSPNQKESISPVCQEDVKIIIDVGDLHGPLVGASTGFKNAHGEYSVLLPCDTPFISKEIMDLLFEISPRVDAVIPRWPNGYIEPLQAVYMTSSALAAAETALEKGEMMMRSMISLLKRVRYISTEVLKQLDPQLVTFFNINNEMDLKRAESLIKKGMGAYSKARVRSHV